MCGCVNKASGGELHLAIDDREEEGEVNEKEGQ